MKKETKHTPLPWAVNGPVYQEDDTDCVSVFSGGEAEKRPLRAQGDNPKQALANADFIVLACNAHDDLLEALETAYVHIDPVACFSRWEKCKKASRKL